MKFTLLDKWMLIPVANPMTRNQIMSSAEIAEDILIQFQIPLIFANHESEFVLKMKWVINQIRIKSLCQLLFLIVIQFFPTRIELSNNLRMRSKFHFILFYSFTPKEKMKDAISNPCSIFLAICTAFYILWMKLDLLISNLRDSSKLFN